MAIALGSSTCVCGLDCDNPLDSVASTFCVCTGLAGKGTVLTRVTPIALPPPPAPQFEPCPLPAIHAYITIARVNAPCRAADHARLRPQLSCSKNISPLAMGL